jgi:hypothetical protein
LKIVFVQIIQVNYFKKNKKIFFQFLFFSIILAEKFFATLEHPVVPVVLGRTNYSYFIPSSGYIDARQFSKMKLLAEYLNKTRDDKNQYLSYFSWKKDYVWGLNNFFAPFCDLCVRLHLDSKPNVIDDMQKWWFNDACQSAYLPQ